MKPIDRRRHPRARDVQLTATVWTSNIWCAPFVISDLSAGGAHLVGAIALVPGEHLELVLAGGERQPLAMTAEVIRVEPARDGECRAAVRFVEVPDRTQDLIQHMVLQALESSRATARPAVLIVDDVPAVCSALERDVHALGQATICARTPMDAVGCIEDPGNALVAAIVDIRLGSANGLDILGYLADEHATIRRIAMSGASDIDLEDVVADGRADALLAKPWHRRELARVLSM